MRFYNRVRASQLSSSVLSAAGITRSAPGHGTNNQRRSVLASTYAACCVGVSGWSAPPFRLRARKSRTTERPAETEGSKSNEQTKQGQERRNDPVNGRLGVEGARTQADRNESSSEAENQADRRPDTWDHPHFDRGAMAAVVASLAKREDRKALSRALISLSVEPGRSRRRKRRCTCAGLVLNPSAEVDRGAEVLPQPGGIHRAPPQPAGKTISPVRSTVGGVADGQE